MNNPDISVLDIFKIGVGPSSSHTLGPWLAARQFVKSLDEKNELHGVTRISVLLYGSLAKTGKGHRTDYALMLGLSGKNPTTVDVAGIEDYIRRIGELKTIFLKGRYDIPFDPGTDIVFFYGESLPFHPNALTFLATLSDGTQVAETYYSIGGGFLTREGQQPEQNDKLVFAYPMNTAADVLAACASSDREISLVVFKNEKAWHKDAIIRVTLHNVWKVMEECIYRGVTTEGLLPGGLNVNRRAAALGRALLDGRTFENYDELCSAIRKGGNGFAYTLDWVSCFALAVNEENAAMGRVVTAPTNGAAGVVPAVFQYYRIFYNKERDTDVFRYLLTAGIVGVLFKKGATLSAAMGGCQAEIGVSSAMAAAGLAELLGGSPRQCLMAAEIAMEHHLGMTCDPVGGLVQIPCIERNAMGAVKAITAAQLALKSDPAQARVSLDAVIKTMWETSKDMHHHYKETSEGGLAINVGLADC